MPLIPGIEGFGLTASYYNGANFDTLITRYVQPVIDLYPDLASPAPGVNVDNFSAKFEGKIKGKGKRLGAISPSTMTTARA